MKSHQNSLQGPMVSTTVNDSSNLQGRDSKNSIFSNTVGPDLSKQILCASSLVYIISKHVLCSSQLLDFIQTLRLEITHALQVWWGYWADILILLSIKEREVKKPVEISKQRLSKVSEHIWHLPRRKQEVWVQRTARAAVGTCRHLSPLINTSSSGFWRLLTTVSPPPPTHTRK